METRLTLRPGMPGTKKLQARFGERLVCVRYLYDEQNRRRLKRSSLSWRRSSGSRASADPAEGRTTWSASGSATKSEPCGRPDRKSVV